MALHKMKIALSNGTLASIREFRSMKVSDRDKTVLEWLSDHANGGAKDATLQRVWYAWSTSGMQELTESRMQILCSSIRVNVGPKRAGAEVVLSDKSVQEIIHLGSLEVEGRFSSYGSSVQEFLSSCGKGGLKDSTRQALWVSWVNLGKPSNGDGTISLADLKEVASRAGLYS